MARPLRTILRGTASAILGAAVGALACALVFRAMSGDYRWSLALAIGGSCGLGLMVALGDPRPRAGQAADAPAGSRD